MTTIFKKQQLNGGSVVWADPTNVEHTVRAKVGSSKKNTSAGVVNNVSTEVVNVIPADIVKGDKTASETLSIRVRLSGSVNNAALLKAEWSATKAHVDAIIAAGGVEGFIPSEAVIASL